PVTALRLRTRPRRASRYADGARRTESGRAPRSLRGHRRRGSTRTLDKVLRRRERPGDRRNARGNRTLGWQGEARDRPPAEEHGLNRRVRRRDAPVAPPRPDQRTTQGFAPKAATARAPSDSVNRSTPASSWAGAPVDPK